MHDPPKQKELNIHPLYIVNKSHTTTIYVFLISDIVLLVCVFGVFEVCTSMLSLARLWCYIRNINRVFTNFSKHIIR